MEWLQQNQEKRSQHFPSFEHLSGEPPTKKVISAFISEAMETTPTFYREYFAALMTFPSHPSF